ncbi:MAG: ribonuclease HI family protein [Candidatus Kerfeldbacteria bacterium]|nr:ribonuclease HI family protein [Candidatus Kerfeldbacteria bacterium]
MKHLITYTDGGARGNPGPAAIGVMILDDKRKLVKAWGHYIGETTNNQAEYQALLAALQEAKKLKAEIIDCYLDSELVVKQMRREYKIKDKALGQLFIKIWNLLQNFNKVQFHHIARELNKRADALVNKALDKLDKQELN